ncbi:signal peptidase I [Sinanaerobacter chloroacetimidivorans]|uniref:Signal peptidase I n=1 Tax=Sinanaerobacter chloroacetimidivorans TaxID=2818044 RepID=A0A8J8B1E3_9FIRM|nr:signal peptidase I [Sinanaerobacter chloroacetimidivorans]MBR0597637.1 signal peptidase I [Sinanaerobacter chloroacetimidivorans]
MANSEDNRPFKEKYRIYIYPVVLAWIVTMLVRPVISDGNAMLPGIQDGQVIIVAKHTYTTVRGTPEFQQVVAFREDFLEEGEKGENTIRRVIGLPGDKIEIKDGKVFRNDEVLEEDYIIGDTEGDVGPMFIGEDEVFVLGDNREESVDSRDSRVGPLKMEMIRGSCAITVWPINQIGRIK